MTISKSNSFKGVTNMTNRLKLKVYYNPHDYEIFITHAYRDPRHLVKEIWKNNPRKVVVEFLTRNPDDKTEIPRGQKIFTEPFELGKEIRRWLDCLKIQFDLAGVLFCYEHIGLHQFIPLSDAKNALKVLDTCLNRIESACDKFLEDELCVYLVTGLGTVIPIVVNSRTWFDGARELIKKEVEAFVESVDTPFAPNTAVTQEPVINGHDMITTVWKNFDLVAFHVNPDEAHRDFYDSFYSKLLNLEATSTRVVKDQDDNVYTLYDLPRLIAFAEPKQNYTCISVSGDEKIVSKLNEAIEFLEGK